MGSRRIVGIDGGVEDLQFQIKPKSVLFEKKAVHNFTLYLEKGLQVLGSYQSGTKHHPKDTLFRFKRAESSVFRIKNSNHATFSWNFYRVDPIGEEEVLEDSVSFNLKRTIDLYLIELREKEKEVHAILRDKSISKRAILDAWNQVKKEMTNSQPILRTVLPKLSIHVEFQVIILNFLDIELEQSKQKMRRSRSESVDFNHRSIPKRRSSYPKLIRDGPKKAEMDTKIAIRPNKTKKEGVFQSYSQILADFKNQQFEETKVSVTNPNGQIVDKQVQPEDEFEETAVPIDKTFFKKHLRLPYKLSENLSDIIQRSHQGSSNHDYFKNGGTPSNDIKFYSDKIDEQDELLEDHKYVVNAQSGMNKFKTLPYQHSSKNKKGANPRQFRRSATSKPQKDQDELSISSNDHSFDLPEKPVSSEKAKSSGDSFASYILLTALLIIAVIIGQQLFFVRCKGRGCVPGKTKGRQTAAPSRAR